MIFLFSWGNSLRTISKYQTHNSGIILHRLQGHHTGSVKWLPREQVERSEVGGLYPFLPCFRWDCFSEPVTSSAFLVDLLLRGQVLQGWDVYRVITALPRVSHSPASEVGTGLGFAIGLYKSLGPRHQS